MSQPFEPIPVPTDSSFLFQGRDRLYVRARYTNLRCVSSEHVGFGQRDRFGREIGARITTAREDVVPRTDTHNLAEPARLGTGWFTLVVHATRDGKVYGACQPTLYFKSATERDAAIEKYLAGARKRAAKVAR